MPYVVPVSLGKLFKELFWYVVLGLLGIGFTGQAFEHRNWCWFAGFLLFTFIMFMAAGGQVIFIRRVTKDR